MPRNCLQKLFIKSLTILKRRMHKYFVKLAILLCATSVLLGAFAAHVLKSHLSNQAIAVFETAVRYQFYHAFALLIVALLFDKFNKKWAIRTCWFFVAGLILFSGSLYALSLLMPDYSYLGIITPFGGVCFILGWISMYISVVKIDAEK